ncbi:MAG: polyprenyl synthetase family protein [Bacteroidales bacterium]
MLTVSEIENVVEKGLRSLDWKMQPQELYEPIEYLISIGGKRLRPRLAILCYNLFSENIDKSIIYPAIGLEVFHGFTLIHDDIMDGADLRRNQPTVHKKWDNNIAILSGDVMCIKSYQMIANAPEKCLREILDIFSDTAAKVCEGQQYDMNYEYEPFITTEDYIQMIGLKTAVLIACSAKIGALIGGAGKETSEALYNYGYKLGLAFQIKDDLLDSFGETAVFGKNIGGDIMNNKKTWLLVESLKRATGEDRAELDYLLRGKDIKREVKIPAMQNLFRRIGIVADADKEIERLHTEARDILAGAGLDKRQLEQLSEFANILLNRER